jgi:phenylalanyl-tRNA synthetase beta subunit
MIKQIGFLGEVHPDVLEKIGLKYNAYIFEINLDILVLPVLAENYLSGNIKISSGNA